MTSRALVALGLVAIVVWATPLLAHHSWPVDRSRSVTVSGTVTGYEWGSPHVMIGLDVRAENGSVEKWNVGGPSPNRMEANGWTPTTLKTGDVITATGYRFSDGQRVLQLDKIVMADGKEMFLYGTK